MAVITIELLLVKHHNVSQNGEFLMEIDHFYRNLLIFLGCDSLLSNKLFRNIVTTLEVPFTKIFVFRFKDPFLSQAESISVYSSSDVTHLSLSSLTRLSTTPWNVSFTHFLV